MRALLLFVLLLGASLIAGCATMTQTPAEVRANYDRILDTQLRMMADDTNFALMIDRPSRLTRWQTR